ncbi:MAG: M48 family metalloprotease [Bryobacteraceae bacterium]
MEAFSVAENRISRDRELIADRVAADAAGGRNLATGLVKVVAFSGLWDQLLSAMRSYFATGKKVKCGENEYDAEVFFSDTTSFMLLTSSVAEAENVLDGLDAKTVPHPADSHPPLSERLQALGVTLPEIADDSRDVIPEPSAISVIDNHEEVDTYLAHFQQRAVKRELR